MNIAFTDSFHKSLEKLGPSNAPFVWQTVAELGRPDGEKLLGLHVEPLYNTPDNFRSCRVNDSIRIISAKLGADAIVLLHVNTHDAAYAWAENTRCRINPVTHAPEFYRVEETPVKQAPAPGGASGAPAPTDTAFPPAGDRPDPFRNWPTDSALLRLGIPEEQLPVVRGVRNSDDLVEKKEKGLFPDAAWDLLVTLVDEPTALPKLLEDADKEAQGIEKLGTDAPLERILAASSAAKASFYLSGDDRLNAQRAGALEAWRVFLLPEQRKIAERSFNGPVFVSGGAGTGKTVVALHHVRWLLENVFTDPSQRILLATFTRTLADSLKDLLAKLCTPEQTARVDVCTVDAAAKGFLDRNGRRLRIDYDSEADSARKWMKAAKAAAGANLRFDPGFLIEEYEEVVEANDIADETSYLRVSRAGRRGSLTQSDRKAIWHVFEAFQRLSGGGGAVRKNEAMNQAIRLLASGAASPYAAAVVDETQDLNAVSLRLLAAFTGNSKETAVKDSLLLVGDANQRIYGRPVKLAKCGIQVRGRSKRLKMNYRCTERIRRRAESILRGVPIVELDEGDASLKGGISAVLGEWPQEDRADDSVALAKLLSDTMKKWKESDGDSRKWSDYAVLVSTNGQAKALSAALENNWIPAVQVTGEKKQVLGDDKVRVLTMHRAKGLEFVGVGIVVEKGKWPALPKDYATLSETEKSEVVAQAKSLLYVAMTRAMSHVLLTGAGPAPDELPPA